MMQELESSLLAPIAQPASRAAWLRGWLLRVGFVYWMLYAGSVVVYCCLRLSFLDPLSDGLTWLFQEVDRWVGVHVLGVVVPDDLARNGSGDRLIDWIHLFTLLAVAVLAGSLWAVCDRRRVHDARLREVLRGVLRYALGFAMLAYGLSKLLVLQFPPPSDMQLLQRWGDSSPMNVLWTFMGASPAYEIFTGAAETLGAVLVVFRRTTLLGALVLAAVMVNVVMLNFCYDVCVKLFSSHLLVMSLALIAAEADRLLDVLVRARAVAAPPPPPTARRGWRIAKVAMIALAFIGTAQWEAKRFGDRHDSPWLRHWATGHWLVTSLVRDGHEVAVDDATRWDRVRFQADGAQLLMRWRFQAGYGPLYSVTIDEAQHVLRIVGEVDPPGPIGPPVTLRYELGDATHLTVHGQIDGHAVDVQLHKAVANAMRLRTRGFHWISDEPYNR